MATHFQIDGWFAGVNQDEMIGYKIVETADPDHVHELVYRSPSEPWPLAAARCRAIFDYLEGLETARADFDPATNKFSRALAGDAVTDLADRVTGTGRAFDLVTDTGRERKPSRDARGPTAHQIKEC